MLLLEPLSLNGLFSLLTGEFPSQNYDTCATQFYSILTMSFVSDMLF